MRSTESVSPPDRLRIVLFGGMLGTVVIAGAALWFLRVSPVRALEDRGGAVAKNSTGQVISVTLPGTHFGDEDLRVIANWKSLEELDLRGTSVSDATLVDVAGELPALRKLTLFEQALSEKLLTDIVRANGVRELRLVACSGLTSAVLVRVAGAKPAESLLTIERMSISAADYRKLAALPAVALTLTPHDVNPCSPRIRLDWHHEHPRPAMSLRSTAPLSAHDLLSVPSPELVTSFGAELLPGAARELGRFKEIKECLSPGKVGDDDLRAMAQLPRVARLFLVGGGYSDAGLEALRGQPTITTLHLRSEQVVGPGVSALATLPALRQLFAEFPRSSPESWVGEFHAPQLESLALTEMGIHDAHLALLADMDDLTELYLYGNPLTDAALPTIEALPRLKLINLYDTQVTPAQSEALAKRIAARPQPLTPNP